MMELLKDLWLFMRERKKYWLVPLIILMVFFGGVLFLAEGSALAPLIYAIF